MTTRTTRLLSLCAALLTATANAQQAGLTAETWNNVLPQSSSIVVLQQKGISLRAPDSTAVTGAQVSGAALGARKGMRLRGTITPVESDTYTFWISGCDNVALWLSEDGSRFNKQLIAYNLTTTNLAEWDKHVNQKSLPIQLVGGQSYYLEAQVMDYDGGGHISIGWRGQKGRYALNLNGSVATQSTTKWNAVASRAIDGNTSGIWGKGEVTLTENVPSSWLQVTFPGDRAVNQVVLYNASTGQNQLSNFRLSLLDANDVELFGENFFTTSGNVGNSMTWNLPATVQGARKLKIQLLGNNLAGNGTLSIAEIEAYGVGFVPGQVDFREVIPTSYLSTLQADPDDANDNNLSDTWETQTGLSTSTLPGAHAEYGDPDNDGISNFQEQWLGANPLAKEAVADGLTRSIWMGINGPTIPNMLAAKSFYSYPNSVTQVPGVDDSIKQTLYGSRYRGTIVAPVTGDYRFWVCGSAGAELWLADGSVQPPGASQPLTNRFGKKRIGTSGYVTPLRDFDYSMSQRSGWIHLEQGQSYYIEVLHSQQNGSGDHISVAWQVPGQTRTIIPNTVFQSDIPEDGDADNDNLPDAWESSVALSPTDNGYTDLKQGEFGDIDADGLSNLQEYQYGTNPKFVDSDGDGYSDSDEVNLYRSNPLVSNNLAPAILTLPPLNQFSSATGGWTTNANGSISAQERRGDIAYTFTVTQPGVHEVVVAAAAIVPSPWYATSVPLSLTLDGDANAFASQTLSCKNSLASNMRAVTPWLAAGTHTITIHHENFAASCRLRIDGVTVKRLGGADLDQDGVPDWIEQNAAADNALTRVPTQSRTSPVSIEGKTSRISSTSLSVLAPGAHAPAALNLIPSINNTFFADVPLSTAGAVTLDASFQSGLLTESESIIWIPTNLFDSFANGTLHIRAGDALRLDAWSGEAADGLPFTVTTNGTLLADENQVTAHTSGQPFVATFAEAGTYTLVASHRGQQTTVTLQVHSANFGPSHLVLAYLARAWTPGSLDSTAQVQADERIVVTETTVNPQTGPRTFLVKAEAPINRYVIARLPEDADGAPSAILARGTVHAFDVGTSPESGDAQVLTQYSDGTWLMRTSFVAVNLPPDILIRLTSNNQGTLFTNGTTTLDLRAGDFDANGIAAAYFEWSGTGALPKLCHSVRIFIEP
ncbi:MAG TPA: PA14 domain-containing protein [Luteolibacter sp.]|nr:PA14 domain-containing protein [Luteolibacter sp.]